MNGWDWALLGAGAVAAYWIGTKVSAGAGSVAQAVNPTSDRNLAYRGVNSIGQSVTGDGYWNLGGWLYDVTHPGIQTQIAASVKAHNAGDQ